MSVFAKFSYAQEGNTVPYPPCREPGRTNNGYVDLRGRPDLVASIHEAQKSPALTALLKCIATSDEWMSLGCDMGTRKELDGKSASHWAGGYVQITSTDFFADYDRFKALAEAIYDEAETSAEGESWRLSFQVGDVRYTGAQEELDLASLWVWFDAGGHTHQAASDSRERFLSVITRTLFDVADRVSSPA